MGSRILRMPRVAVGLVEALCIGAPVGWIASEAEADPITSSAAAAAKLLATSLFRNLASEIYKNDCSRGDEPAKVNFICGALGSFSDRCPRRRRTAPLTGGSRSPSTICHMRAQWAKGRTRLRRPRLSC